MVVIVTEETLNYVSIRLLIKTLHAKTFIDIPNIHIDMSN